MEQVVAELDKVEELPTVLAEQLILEAEVVEVQTLMVTMADQA